MVPQIPISGEFGEAGRARRQERASDWAADWGTLSMSRESLAKSRVRILAVASIGLLLAGCGAGDIELNGKVFDYLGVSSDTQTRGRDPKIAARSGLVLPPSADRLPEPGSAPQGEDSQLASLDDPDRKAVVTKTELERQQAEYCRINYEQAKARGDETTAINAKGPLGPCAPSIFTSLQKWQKEE